MKYIFKLYTKKNNLHFHLRKDMSHVLTKTNPTTTAFAWPTNLHKLLLNIHLSLYIFNLSYSKPNLFCFFVVVSHLLFHTFCGSDIQHDLARCLLLSVKRPLSICRRAWIMMFRFLEDELPSSPCLLRSWFHCQSHFFFLTEGCICCWVVFTVCFLSVGWEEGHK